MREKLHNLIDTIQEERLLRKISRMLLSRILRKLALTVKTTKSYRLSRTTLQTSLQA